MIAVRIVHGVTGHFMIRCFEWFNSAVLLNYGFTLLRTHGGTFKTSHSFDVMAAIAPQDSWGWFLMVLAVFRIGALCLNGTFEWFRILSPWARVVTAYISAFAWFSISAALFWGNTLTPGPGTYFLIMVTDILIAGVVAREAARNSVRKPNGGP